MGQPFHLRCLGRPQLISPGGEAVRFKVRKHLALLTYLALEPRVPHRREKLADLLWGKVPPPEGRHSLATAASVIRGKLGREALEGDRDHLRLAAAGFTVDLERLAAGDLFGDEYTPPLAVGGFLDDFDIPEEQEFMLWRERQRARWLPLVRDALVRQIDRCRRTGDFRQIEHLGDSLLEIDELSEDGIRAKMEARAFDGDRLTSLKIYEAWKIRLAAELKATPSPVVEGIAIRLRRRDWDPAPSNIPTVPTDQWRGRPFVGRGTEYRILYEGWEKTLQHNPHHALVLGDSGVGKSTLIERLATAAGLEGGAVSRISCYELEREIPYAAIGGLVTGLLDRPGASATPPEWLAELGRTVPEIRRRFPAIPEPVESQGETARIRLTEAVQQLVLAIADEHPVILVIDDVHLADDASLAVLHLLMRRTQDQRVLVLLAARSAELGKSPQAARLRDGHEPLRMQILDLQPMTERESEELLTSFLVEDPIQPTTAARRALLHAAAGFPMVLEYLVKDWRENGDQCLALSIGAMTEDPPTACAPDQTYHLIVQRIMQSLDPSVRNVLSMASVLGARLNDIEMYRLADVTIGQAMTALGRLADLRILRDGGRGLEFCNEVVRGEAYLGIPSPVRRILHRSISDQLVRREANGTAVSGLEIAWHCIRCGLLGVATPYLLRGARQAIRKGAPNEAERALETALGHLDEPARTDALLLMAEACYEQGKWELLLERTHSCTFTSDDPRKVAALTLQLEPRFRLGLTNDCSSDEIVRDVKALPLAMADVAFRIRAIRYVAYVLVIRRDDVLAALLSDMITCFKDVPLEIDYAANLSVARATLHYHNRDIGAAVTELRRAAEGLDAEGIRNLVSAGVRLGLANIYSSSGQYDLAVEENLKAFKIASMLDNHRNLSRIAANISMCHARLSRYSEAISWGMTSVELNTSFNFDFRPYALLHIGSSMAMLGRNEEAEEVLRKLVKVAECATDASLHQNAALYAAEVAAVMGQPTTAMHLARFAMERSSTLLYKNSAGIFARWSTKVLYNDQSAAAAKEFLDSIHEQLADYDTIDQADVTCASIWLDDQTGKKDSDKIDQLRRLLGRLPPGITDHLRRAGFLELDSQATIGNESLNGARRGGIVSILRGSANPPPNRDRP